MNVTDATTSTQNVIDGVKDWINQNAQTVTDIIEGGNGFRFTRNMYDEVMAQENSSDANYLHTYFFLEEENQMNFAFIHSEADSEAGTRPEELPTSSYAGLPIPESLDPGEMSHSKALERYENWQQKRAEWLQGENNTIFAAFQNRLSDITQYFSGTTTQEIFGFIALRVSDNVPEIIFCNPENTAQNPADVSYPVPPFGNGDGLSESDFQLYVSATQQ